MGHHQGVTAYPAARNAGGSRFWGRDFRIRAVDGVTDVHHVHAWSLTSGMNVFSSHVCVRAWSEVERVLSEVIRLLRDRYNLYFSTTQIVTGRAHLRTPFANAQSVCRLLLEKNT